MEYSSISYKRKEEDNDMIQSFQLKRNGVSTVENLNILLLDSYDVLIVVDSFQEHKVILDCYNKILGYRNEYENLTTIVGVLKVISIR